eukprot:6473359-Amphidinium_carterae.1
MAKQWSFPPRGLSKNNVSTRSSLKRARDFESRDDVGTRFHSIPSCSSLSSRSYQSDDTLPANPEGELLSTLDVLIFEFQLEFNPSAWLLPAFQPYPFTLFWH